MAKVRFTPASSKSKRHITVEDCDIGDIIYIEDNQIFGLIVSKGIKESKVADLADGNIDYFNNQTLCRKFVSEIGFNVEDFLEFI